MELDTQIPQSYGFSHSDQMDLAELDGNLTEARKALQIGQITQKDHDDLNQSPASRLLDGYFFSWTFFNTAATSAHNCCQASRSSAGSFARASLSRTPVKSASTCQCFMVCCTAVRSWGLSLSA